MKEKVGFSQGFTHEALLSVFGLPEDARILGFSHRPVDDVFEVAVVVDQDSCSFLGKAVETRKTYQGEPFCWPLHIVTSFDMPTPVEFDVAKFPLIEYVSTLGNDKAILVFREPGEYKISIEKAK